MVFALILFLVTYVLLLLLPKYRSVVALGSALIFVVSGIRPVKTALSAVDFNVIRTEVTDYLPYFLLAGIIVLLIAVSFVPGKPTLTNGLICMSLFVVGGDSCHCEET